MSSQNFSKASFIPGLLTMPEEVRTRLYELIMRPYHKVYVCDCG